MDPQATFDELLSALADRDWDRVAELSDALLGWLQKEGFPPQTLGSQKLGKDWHRAVATFICTLAMAEARKGRKGDAS